MQEQLKREEEGKARQQSQYKSLEERNVELTKSLEIATVSAAGAPLETSHNLHIELKETKTKLNEALARLEEDDIVVAKWSGKSTVQACR